MDVLAMQRRMRLALDMAEAGVAMFRARIRREFPDLSDDEVDQRVREWRLGCPGADPGDLRGTDSGRAS